MRFLLLIFGTQIIFATASAQTIFSPPPTSVIPVKDTLHGLVLTDNYRWLEDKEDPKVIEWTKIFNCTFSGHRSGQSAEQLIDNRDFVLEFTMSRWGL